EVWIALLESLREVIENPLVNSTDFLTDDQRMKCEILNDLYKEDVEYAKKNFTQFKPTPRMCEVWVDGIKAIYLGTCGRCNTILREYAVITSYFAHNPVMIKEHRCSFNYVKVQPLTSHINIVIWETGERTLEPKENVNKKQDTENEEPWAK